MLIKSRNISGVSRFRSLGRKVANIVLEIGRRIMRFGIPSDYRNCFTRNRERGGLRWQGRRIGRQGRTGENRRRGAKFLAGNSSRWG